MPTLNVTRSEAEHLAAGALDESVREKAAKVAKVVTPAVHRPLAGQTDIYDHLEQHGS